jgi:hypothetical protein
MDLAFDHIVVDDGLREKRQLACGWSKCDGLAEVSSKKKRLTGKLAKYVTYESGSWAFAKRADKRTISKVRNGRPLDVEPIAALIESACVDRKLERGMSRWRGWE